MSVPLRQSLTVGRYLVQRRLKHDDKFPLLVELSCSSSATFACSFCGKIQYLEHILRKRMPVDTALAAIEERRPRCLPRSRRESVARAPRGAWRWAK